MVFSFPRAWSDETDIHLFSGHQVLMKLKFCSCPSLSPASRTRPQPPPCPPSQLPPLPSFPQQAVYKAVPPFQLSPPPPNQRTTSASAPALWSSGFGRRVKRRGISATEMPGFDSRAAKQNFPQQLPEDFRNHPPPLDRRRALGGELFGFLFLWSL